MNVCKQCGKEYEPCHVKQEDCSELCLCIRFDSRAKKTRKLARIFAMTQGYRSMGEVRYAARLKQLQLPFSYETAQLKYQYDPQKYVVDFKIDDTDILLEYKGKLDGPTRKKMRAIKTSNPDADIRFVFEKPQNKLYRGAKMRYWEWAERYGFKWYDVNDLGQLKKDIMEAKRARKKSKASKKTSPTQAKGLGGVTPKR